MVNVEFTGRELKTGKWVQGLLAASYGKVSYITDDFYKKKFYKVETKTVGQFSGFKDKFGLKIFKGDVIFHKRIFDFGDNYYTGEPIDDNRTETTIAVCHYNNCYGFHFIGLKKAWNDADHKLLYNWRTWEGKLTCLSARSEKLGNINDNPDLIKQLTT